MFGVDVSDMQTNVSVSGDKITGTLKYLSGDNAIVNNWGAGYFLNLKFSGIDESATSVMVGLTPSAGSGLVELINDPDMNGVFKITDPNAQKFTIISTDGTKETVQTFDLKGLTMATS